MATITTAWKLVFTLGSLIWGSSLLMALKIKFLDIDFGSAPAGFKDTMYGLSCIVLVVWIGKGIVAIIHSIERVKQEKIKTNYLKDKFKKK